MTRILEFSPELEAQLERAAAQLQTDVPTFIQQAVEEKTARLFDEARFEHLLESNALEALDSLLETTPDRRARAGVSPSSALSTVMKSQLERLAHEMDQLIVNREAQISTVVDTGYDELGFVGTSDAYLRLVKEVLTFLSASQSNELVEWRAGNIKIQGTTQVNQVFDSTCEVVIDTLGLVESEQDTQAASHYFKQSSPLSEPLP